MADTIQGVSWALEQACPLRQSSDWKNPRVALSTLEGEHWGDSWLFSGADFLELLKRCEAQHIDVYYIQHVSASGEEDRNEIVKHHKQNAIEVFERMMNQGLNERFMTNLKVPEGTVNAWWGKRPD
jgi:hypothetical protein